MRTGILHSTGFYLVSGGFMLLLSILGRAREGAYWRHTLFLVLLLLELTLLSSPTKASPSTSSSRRFSVLWILNRILPSQPQFLQIRLLHRIFASASIGITQLAGVWANDTPNDKQAMEQAMALVRGLESDAGAAFLDEVVPLLRNARDPVAQERAIQAEMEQVLIDRTLSSHPQVRPIWMEAISRAKAQEFVRGMADIDVAMRIPLPPSPPPSPVLGPRRL